MKEIQNVGGKGAMYPHQEEVPTLMSRGRLLGGLAAAMKHHSLYHHIVHKPGWPQFGLNRLQFARGTARGFPGTKGLLYMSSLLRNSSSSSCCS